MAYLRQKGAEQQPRFLRDDVSCFEYEGVPVEQQLSTPPGPDDKAKFYKWVWRLRSVGLAAARCCSGSWLVRRGGERPQQASAARRAA
jgi:hypothetical protein